MGEVEPYLPRRWNDDQEMNGYMSMLKARHVNPINYDRIVEFWKNLIDSYCAHENKCVISYDELKIKFKRNDQLPAPIPKVLEELYNKGCIIPTNELSSPRQGWLQWGASLVKSSWLTGAKIDFRQVEVIHLPTLKALARNLMDFYKIEYEMVDCSDVVAYDELKSRSAGVVCHPSSFDYVIDELIRQGEISEGTSENGDRILKFKDNTSKGPAKFTAADASVHELRRTMTKVDMELRKIEQRVKKFAEEAKECVRQKDKSGALAALRKKQRAQKEMADKDIQYQRLVGMLEQLANTKQSREIMDAYKTGTRAYKNALERQGLTVDKIDETMDSIHEAMQDANNIDEAFREGFNSMPAASSVDDALLEKELNDLIDDNTGRKMDAEHAQLGVLPDVPEGLVLPSDDEVMQRVRRLRYGMMAP